MKAFDLVLGSAMCLFGVFRKLVIAVVAPVAIIVYGLRRIFKMRPAAPRG